MGAFYLSGNFHSEFFSKVGDEMLLFTKKSKCVAEISKQ